MPSIHGEKVVIRLLAGADTVPPLDETGLERDQVATLCRCALGRAGLVLITGPTGSGKTNTLYSRSARSTSRSATS